MNLVNSLLNIQYSILLLCTACYVYSYAPKLHHTRYQAQPKTYTAGAIVWGSTEIRFAEIPQITGKIPKLARVCYVRYRYSWYRYGCRTELTEVSGAGIDVVPKLPKCPVPVLMSYRTYRSGRYRYLYRTEVTEKSGTGIGVVPNLPKYPVPALVSYRTYRSGNTGGIYRRYASVRTVPKTPFVCCSKCTLWIII